MESGKKPSNKILPSFLSYFSCYSSLNGGPNFQEKREGTTRCNIGPFYQSCLFMTDLAILNPILLQHFCLVLSKKYHVTEYKGLVLYVC
jgi:hypothetical protein